MNIEQDASDLQACGLVAKYWRWRRVYYALKDVMLMAYGTFDGLVLQVWQDDDWQWVEGEVWAEHRHILMQYSLGGIAFHMPTNEFDYFNYGLQVQKRSDHYAELYPVCLGSIVGLKKYSLKADDEARAFEGLKRLVKRYGALLRPAEQSAQPDSFMPDHVHVEIAPGVIAHVSPDIDDKTVEALRGLADAALKQLGADEA